MGYSGGLATFSAPRIGTCDGLRRLLARSVYSTRRPTTRVCPPISSFAELRRSDRYSLTGTLPRTICRASPIPAGKWSPTMLYGLRYIASYLLGTDVAGRGMAVYADDTFIASFPRSGNTWTRF